MTCLTPEELAELASLEAEEAKRLEADVLGARRQHLEALRMSKRLAAKYGVPGRDFVVLETTLGNIAVRRPIDVEIDGIDEATERPDLEKFAAAIVIEPDALELQKLMAEHHGLVGALVTHSSRMLKVTREAEVKK